MSLSSDDVVPLERAPGGRLPVLRSFVMLPLGTHLDQARSPSSRPLVIARPGNGLVAEWLNEPNVGIDHLTLVWQLASADRSGARVVAP